MPRVLFVEHNKHAPGRGGLCSELRVTMALCGATRVSDLTSSVLAVPRARAYWGMQASQLCVCVRACACVRACVRACVCS